MSITTEAINPQDPEEGVKIADIIIKSDDAIGLRAMKQARAVYDFSKKSVQFTFIDEDVDLAANTIKNNGAKVVAGDAILFTSTGTLPSPLIARVVYYVQMVFGESFSLSATKWGAIIDLTALNGGTHTARTNTQGEIGLGVSIPEGAIVVNTAIASLQLPPGSGPGACPSPTGIEVSFQVALAYDLVGSIDLAYIRGYVQGKQDGRVNRYLEVKEKKEIAMLVEGEELSSGIFMIYVNYFEAIFSEQIYRIKGDTRRRVYHRVAISTTYNATGNEDVIGVKTSNGAMTINLPKICDVGERMIRIKDEDAKAASFNITIVPASGDLIENAANIKISTNLGSRVIYNDGGINWWVLT